MTDHIGFMKTIITHITNENEERPMNVMGGTVIEKESDKIKIQMIVELGKEDGLSDEAILARLQKKIGLSFEKAKTFLSEYGKPFV